VYFKHLCKRRGLHFSVHFQYVLVSCACWWPNKGRNVVGKWKEHTVFKRVVLVCKIRTCGGCNVTDAIWEIYFWMVWSWLKRNHNLSLRVCSLLHSLTRFAPPDTVCAPWQKLRLLTRFAPPDTNCASWHDLRPLARIASPNTIFAPWHELRPLTRFAPPDTVCDPWQETTALTEISYGISSDSSGKFRAWSWVEYYSFRPCYLQLIIPRYSLRAGCPGIESRWRARFSAPVQPRFWAHPVSHTIGTGSLSRG
jgi:hypothetical protein